MAPPNWLFAPVWGILYAMIAAALIIYINKQGYGKKSGYIFFVIQLVLNFIWSPVFFGMQNMTLALVIVILMDIFVFLTFKKFYSVSKISGLLLIPYFLWILFATYLNAGYLFLNI
jgi:tryptophan-rich sensory protein